MLSLYRSRTVSEPSGGTGFLVFFFDFLYTHGARTTRRPGFRCQYLATPQCASLLRWVERVRALSWSFFQSSPSSCGATPSLREMTASARISRDLKPSSEKNPIARDSRFSRSSLNEPDIRRWILFSTAEKLEIATPRT